MIGAGLTSELSDELVRMAEEDRAVRAALPTDDSLPVDRHPMMAKLGRRNAERLNTIIDTIGWPSREVVGALVGPRYGSCTIQSALRT